MKIFTGILSPRHDAGYKVTSVRELASGIKDEEVIQMALQHNNLLLMGTAVAKESERVLISSHHASHLIHLEYHIFRDGGWANELVAGNE